MAAFRNIFVVKSPSLLLLCVYKKSFIDRKIAVSDLKHACLSSPWVSCHVNVLYFGLPTICWRMILLRSSGYQFQPLKITCSAKSAKAEKPGTFRACADKSLFFNQSGQANKPMNWWDLKVQLWSQLFARENAGGRVLIHFILLLIGSKTLKW